MSPSQRHRTKLCAVLTTAVLAATFSTGPALASNLFEGAAIIYEVDQAAQTVVLDGVKFRFNASTRFFDPQGNRTSASALKSPARFQGIPGTKLDPMGVKYEALETGRLPLLKTVEILDAPID